MTDIFIEDIKEVADYFIDSEGSMSIHINLTKASDLIIFVANLYENNEKANLVVNNIDKESFDKFKMFIHSAAIAKMNNRALLIPK